ncbi:MAG: hypothetical protein JNM84_09615 [Planctomycetes bacterium]|nr:hypothetical protein [Planctomycetota bacterium]
MTTSRDKKADSQKKVAVVRRGSDALAKRDAAFASELVRDLSAMIEAAQKQVASVANLALTEPHWQIGSHVRTHVLEGRRAQYGAQIVSTASRQLSERYGGGFNEMSLRTWSSSRPRFRIERLSPRRGD